MQLFEVIDRLAEAVDGLEPGRLSGGDASNLLKLFDRGERLCAAGKTVLAKRAAETKEWARTGARSPQHWLSEVSGESPGQAQRTLETADQLAEYPELDEAVRGGEITAGQASEIARAAKDHPNAIKHLIEQAKTRGYKGFKEACRQVALSSHSREEDQAKAQRQRESRYCRMWTDRDGAGRLDARMAPVEFATFRSFFSPFEREAFDAARQKGEHEPTDRYRADALVAMAEAANANRTAATVESSDQPDELQQLLASDSDEAGPAKSNTKLPAMVIAVIDHAVFERGFALPGERHYIEGIGSVPIQHIEELMQDALIAALVMKGSDVGRGVHLGRHPTALQRTALHVRDPECVIPGCEETEHLEIDHIPEWNQTHHTTVTELARECSLHHDQRTYQGAILSGGPGNWEWQPPRTDGPFDDPPPTSAGRSP